MAEFEYIAYDPDGKMVSGKFESASRTSAIKNLERGKLKLVSLNLAQKGQVVTEHTQKSTPLFPARAELSKNTYLTQNQLVLFTEELSDLLEAGLQLEQALHTMENRQELNTIKDVSRILRQYVRDGSSFSQALKKASPSFDELYCNLVSAGEMAGALPKILRRQATYLSAMENLRNRVMQSLIYPSFIVLSGILLMFFFMTFLVPQLSTLFSKTGQAMPISTLILVKTSGFLGDNWIYIAGLTFLSIGGIIFSIQTKKGREFWDKYSLRAPLIGNILLAKIIAQICQTLSTLIVSGLPLLASVRLASMTAGNLFIQEKLKRIIEMMGDGQSFSKALARTGGWPPAMIDIIQVGEQTGELAVSMEKVAIRYDRDLQRKTDALTALIQPLIIVLLSLLVGLVAYSIMAGIFQSISGLRIKG